MKDIKDYLPYYLGCKCIRTVAKYPRKKGDIETVDLTCLQYFSDQVKPILRPLSDMTEYELQECGNLVYDFSDDDSGLDLNNHRPDDFFLTTSEQFHWLIQRHFDVFGLIESGLAIDKTKLPTNER